MGAPRRQDNPAYKKMAERLDPIKGRIEAFKAKQKDQYDAFMLSIEDERNAAINDALKEGLSRNSVCLYFGITANSAQVAFMNKVAGEDWDAKTYYDPDVTDITPYEMGDWRIKRGKINYLREHPMRQGSGPAFCEGRLWNDVLGLDLKFSINYGDQSTVTYFQQDGTPFDSAHIEEYATADWNGYKTFDDGTFYERGEPGRWFTEGADVADWLEFGYRNKREGWPQP